MVEIKRYKNLICFYSRCSIASLTLVPINFRTTFNLFQVKSRLKSFSIMVSILLGTIFSRIFDAACIVDEKLVLKPNILPQLKPQIETVLDASHWRLIYVFLTKFFDLVFNVASQSLVSHFQVLALIFRLRVRPF